MFQPPLNPKIYHIVHVDRLASIASDGFLWSDASMATRSGAGTTIGMNRIKARRLDLELECRPGLKVGECVPFYFCPRSVMLYLIHKANHEELAFRGGQEPILHLEADLHAAVRWAEKHGKRWAFTLSNAGAYYFESRCDLAQLGEVNWEAVESRHWSPHLTEGKQAEFLMEARFPWRLVERIGVFTKFVARKAIRAAGGAANLPRVEIRRGWYY